VWGSESPTPVFCAPKALCASQALRAGGELGHRTAPAFDASLLAVIGAPCNTSGALATTSSRGISPATMQHPGTPLSMPQRVLRSETSAHGHKSVPITELCET
jgi:hypothetical protein